MNSQIANDSIGIDQDGKYQAASGGCPAGDK